VVEKKAPDFASQQCVSLNRKQITPYDELIWLKASFNMPDETAVSQAPLGLFVSANAASSFYLNGYLLGQNGQPSDTAETEIPGKLDTVFYIPRTRLHKTNNILIIKMSGHHSLLHPRPPIQRMVLAPYAKPGDLVLRNYLPSFLPLGIILSGAFYFGLRFWRQDGQGLLLPLAALFTIAQFTSETSRALYPYVYPVNDIRLLIIYASASASGLCLLLHVLKQFTEHSAVKVAVSFFVAMAPTMVLDSYDAKALVATVCCAIVSALWTFWAVFQARPKAQIYTVVLFTFSGMALWTQYRFLDVYYYYIVAGLLLFLFVEQVRAIADKERQKALEKARADRLQLILDEMLEKQRPSSIIVNHLGKTEHIEASSILFCKSARDYVEFHLKDGRTMMHKSNMVDLETMLPRSFLRVHRSYIVNTDMITALERDSSGTGRLLLANEAAVPVSRRILPVVRKAIQ
jgi:hypothetical protein